MVSAAYPIAYGRSIGESSAAPRTLHSANRTTRTSIAVEDRGISPLRLVQMRVSATMSPHQHVTAKSQH